MPLTTTGKKILKGMEKRYGMKAGNKIFYASINEGKKGSEKWHEVSIAEKYHKVMGGK